MASTIIVHAQRTGPPAALEDPEQELRARNLDTQFRCVVCQSQSIADSDAPLAEDMRRLVRERVSAGDSDEDVRRYLVARYGDYILLKPALQTNTLALWLFPAFGLLAGLGAVFLFFRRSAAPERLSALSDDDEDALNGFLREDTRK